MKNFKLLLGFMFCASIIVVKAQDDDAIKVTLNNYLEGGAVGDTARLNRAFHPLANLRSLSKEGKVSEMPVKRFIAAVPAGGAKWNHKIVNYSYSGTAATAVTEEQFPNFKYVDFLNLLKINGEWRIVSRVFSRVDLTEDVTMYTHGTYAGSTPAVSSSSNTKVQPAAATGKKPAPKPKPSDDGW